MSIMAPRNQPTRVALILGCAAPTLPSTVNRLVSESRMLQSTRLLGTTLETKHLHRTSRH
jgi:hypothetical protein